MRLVFLGPPGAGKGTQAVEVAKELGIPQISTGEILRAAIASGSELGATAKKYIDDGNLVPDDVMIGIIRDRIRKADCANGYILDGFPRTVPQAEALDGMLSEMMSDLSGVVNFTVADDKLIARLAGRRVCRDCNATYHSVFNPSANGDRCAVCNGELYQRSDDTETAIRQRLVTYQQQTAPLIEYYQTSGRLYSVDAGASIEEVQQSVHDRLAEIKEA